MPFDNTAVFTTDPPLNQTATQQAAQFRAQAASLGQLLDVHERVVQQLSDRIARMVAEAAVRQLEASNATRAADHLRHLRQTTQQALREMRLLIFELRPSALEAAGLVAALRARLDAVEGRTGVATAVSPSHSLAQPPLFPL